MADSLGIVIRHLLSQSSVTALVAERIYTGYAATLPNPVYPCVTLTASGGGGMLRQVKTWGRSAFRVYALSLGSAAAATALYVTVYSALQKQMLESGTQLFEVAETSAPAEALVSGDPAVYQCMGLWEMYGRLIA